MQQLLNEALMQIPKLKSGTKFLVRDLFRGYVWNDLPVNTRRDLGRFFFEASQNIYLQNGTIEALSKNSAKQQVYIKK